MKPSNVMACQVTTAIVLGINYDDFTMCENRC